MRPSTLLVLSILAPACHGEPEPDDSGGEPEGDTDTDADGDSDTDSDSDTDTDIAWSSLPEACEIPGDLGVSPLSLVGELVVSGVSGTGGGGFFIELVDLEVDAERGLVWGVGQGGLIAFDVSKPSEMELLSAYDQDGSRYYRLELGEDGIVYVTHRDKGLVALDGSDPAEIEKLGSVEAPGLAGMARDGDRLYVVSHGGELVTFSLEDPTEPEEIARTGGLGNAWDLLLAGERAYVADNSLGVGVVDLSDRDAPVVLGAVDPGRGVQDLALDAGSGTLYAAGGGAGVMVLSLDDPDAPELLDTIELEGSVLSVAVGQGRLWAVDQLNVAAFDLSDPRAPRLLGTVETPQWAMHVAAAGERAFVGDWGQLSIWEANPEVEAPDLLVGSGTVVFDEVGEVVEVDLENLGSGTLELTGATVDSAEVEVTVDTVSLEPGEVGRLRIDFAGGELDTLLCLASTDPDEPLQELVLYSGSGDGGSTLGSAAPDFVLSGIDGETYQLSEQLGSPVVLVYFATW